VQEEDMELEEEFALNKILSRRFLLKNWARFKDFNLKNPSLKQFVFSF